MIFLQLWHVGRISHSSFQKDGAVPVAPSAIRPAGNAFKSDFQRAPYETPRALELSEIVQIVADYRKAAENAKRAGFDGIEIHAANGYLLQQFLEDKTNHRTDRYGGSIENRARLLFEVLDAVSDVWPADRIGVRLSPFSSVGDVADSDPMSLYTHVIKQLAARQIGFLHLIEARVRAGLVDQTDDAAPQSVATLLRPFFPGPFLGVGSLHRRDRRGGARRGHGRPRRVRACLHRQSRSAEASRARRAAQRAGSIDILRRRRARLHRLSEPR